MKKLMIASDLHGSAYYCEKLCTAYQREQADRLLLLGDLLYHGPRNDLPQDYNPKVVIERLNAMSSEILCVRGNCDAEVDQMVLSFPLMADYAVLFLEQRTIYATHGHLFNEGDSLILNKGDILLSGHSHVPLCEARGENIYLNPGSVAIPKEGSWHGYMIIENGRFLWKGLDGETKMTADHLF